MSIKSPKLAMYPAQERFFKQDPRNVSVYSIGYAPRHYGDLFALVKKAASGHSEYAKRETA